MTGSADIGLLTIQVVLGPTMAAHGPQRLFPAEKRIREAKIPHIYAGGL